MFIETMSRICLLSPLFAAVVARVGVNYSLAVQRLVIVSMLISFWMSISLFYHVAYLPEPVNIHQYTWGVIGPYRFEFGFWLDAISTLMAVVVSGVSSLVCIYSVGYMQDEGNLSQYFSHVAFFSFSMLWLVFSDNLLQLFFGWEGVGVASYLLIGFWSEKEKTAYAATKAFLFNRVGDMGLVFAMGLTLYAFHSLHYDLILDGKALLSPWWGLTLLDWALLGLLLAAMAKSAQMPMHLWLPDSMVGPTPISALIHAATMVTAGIFLITRFSTWFELSPLLLNLCLVIGMTTAIFMGLVALTEYNLKRIIAYSTISQLGNMLAVCGMSGYAFALFHLVTHAIFKALLFLTAGAIIVTTGHQEDCRDMGGLKANKTIHLAMILGLLSLCAIPPLGGFYSKDSMLLLMQSSTRVYICFLIGSVITSLYSIRLYYLLFWDAKPAVLEPLPDSMTGVLWVLMFLSVWSGVAMLSFLPVLAENFIITDVVQSVLEWLDRPIGFIVHAVFSMGFLATIVCIGSLPYWQDMKVPKDTIVTSGYGLESALSLLIKIYTLISYFFSKGVEFLLDFISVVGTSFWALILGGSAQQLSTGKLYHYMWIMLMGLIVIVKSVI